MELMVCATANKFLKEQRRANRMTVESIRKVTSFWLGKNRPQVIDFMFDQQTQRDLILYNIKTFRFHGPNAENIVQLHTMMQAWKTLAKEMSVRTFCAPDSTIRKHMQDLYRILELMGAPAVTFLVFQEIQVKALKTMRDQELMKSLKPGTVRPWEPIGGFTDGGIANPFADK